MDLSRDIHPLTDFKRHTPEFLRRLKENGHPLVLTVNGKAEIVVQDARSYQRLLDVARRLETIEAVREGLASMKRGEGRPADDVFAEIEKGLLSRSRRVTYQVLIQPSAERDIRAAARWIEEQSKSPAKALQWVRSIRAGIDTLRTSPGRCPIDPDSDAYGEEVRVLLYGKRHGKYRILFAVRGDAVHVLTVRHASRQSLAEELERDQAVDDGTDPPH